RRGCRRTRERDSCPARVFRNEQAFQPSLLLSDAVTPTISVALRRLGYGVVPARRRGLVARYFAFAFAKNCGSRSSSPMSQSTNASLYCGEPNFGTWTNSGLVSSLIACTRRTLRMSNALTL